MFRHIRIIFKILIFTILSSCSQMPNELETAERLMETAPDSALHILQNINKNLLIKHSDKALYALLLSQALDKNGIKVESDSLIQIATDYFDEKDPTRSAYAWFYMARCANNRGNANVQANALLKAQENAEKTDNYKLQALVYSDKANMYKTQQQIDSSICYYKQAYQSFKKSGDNRNSILTLLNAGYCYLYTSQPEKATSFYLLAEKLATHSRETILLSVIYRNIGSSYLQQKDYNKAKIFFHKAPLTGFSFYDSNKWYLLGSAFIETGDTDSARLYLKKVSNLEEIAADYYLKWQTLYEKEGNAKKALYYAKLVTTTTDSVYQRKLDVSFAGMEKKYKYQSLQVSNQELIIKNKQNNILLLITLSIISLGAFFVTLWRYQVKNQQFIIQKKLLEHEKSLVEKVKENNQLLEQQVNMQKILLLNVEQYRKYSVKRPPNTSANKDGISPIMNITFHEELIACMDIQYRDISKRLIKKNPDLSERDILICCLLLAGFDTGMISTILDVKIESITKHRYRLRTKLGLQNSENLIEHLLQF